MRVTAGALPRRADRAIDGARVALAGTALFAVWFDPGEPEQYVGATYALHSIYLVYAAFLALLNWKRVSTPWLPMSTHVLDILVFSIFQYLTLGPSSPFFVFFVFSLFCGALRWGWSGTLATGAVVLAAYVGMGISMARTLELSWEPNRFIIRITYLVMATALLVWLGRYEARLREDLQKLARWPQFGDEDTRLAVPRLLQHAAGIMSAGSAAVVWEIDEEPWLFVASRTDHKTTLEKRLLGGPLVPEPLDGAGFICAEALGPACVSFVSRSGAVSTWTGLPVSGDLLPLVAGIGLASAPFRGERGAGRLFLSGLHVSSDQLPIIEVIAREVGASLDHLSRSEELRRIAIAQERIRFARDLHDGVLQALTGVRLELQSIAAAVAGGGGAAALAHRLRAVERAVALEQRELRLFIQELKPLQTQSAWIVDRLREVESRIVSEWNVPIVMEGLSAVGGDLSPQVEQALPLMVHEAIVNAIRHAEPTHVKINLRVEADYLRVTIADDGRGFSFRGGYDHDALVRDNLGPISLRERLASLGGSLRIESTARGSRVEMSLPLTPVAL